MAELKAGGLAIIISCPWGKNVGKVVRLIRFLGERNSDFTEESGPAWEIYCESGIYSDGGTYKLCGSFSRRLMPIDGCDFSHQDEQQKELTYG
ncbi:hypothetical protein C1N58_12510 [Pantoea sp. SGAir0180]